MAVVGPGDSRAFAAFAAMVLFVKLLLIFIVSSSCALQSNDRISGSCKIGYRR
jgi:hypothetical protein